MGSNKQCRRKLTLKHNHPPHRGSASVTQGLRFFNPAVDIVTNQCSEMSADSNFALVHTLCGANFSVQNKAGLRCSAMSTTALGHSCVSPCPPARGLGKAPVSCNSALCRPTRPVNQVMHVSWAHGPPRNSCGVPKCIVTDWRILMQFKLHHCLLWKMRLSYNFQISVRIAKVHILIQ
jgi:hypothetical protein